MRRYVLSSLFQAILILIGVLILVFVMIRVTGDPARLMLSREASVEQIEAFRHKIRQRHCKFWTTTHDLGGKVSRSMVQLKKKHPSPGWVPGKFAREWQNWRCRPSRAATRPPQTLTN